MPFVPSCASNGQRATRSSYRPNRPSRRRGQALLLAVLLMVFTALLASTFITIVALNLNQTARQEDRTSAQAAVQAGFTYVNQQLLNSPQGEKWRPEMVSPPPAPPGSGPGAATVQEYTDYYTPFDQAQGWARTIPKATNTDTYTAAGITGGDWDKDGTFDPVKDDWAKLDVLRRTENAHAYIKIPDPRQPQVFSPGTPIFLAEVRTVPDADPEKRTMLQVSIIGLSENNPTVFVRSGDYKYGVAQNPLFNNMRVVTNFDFKSQTVPETTTLAGSSTSLLAVADVQNFPETPFYITVSNLTTGAVEGALVTNKTPNAAPVADTLQLSAPLSAAPAAGLRVELSAALGAPPTIDYNRNNVADAALETAKLYLSATDTATQAAAPGGIRVNGGLNLTGNVFSPLLDSSPATTTDPKNTVRVSGLVAFLNTLGSTTVKVTGRYGPNTGESVTDATLVSSSDTNFPGAWGSLNNAQKDSLFSDGLNRLVGNASAPTRQVKSFTPPDISGGGNGIGHYRQISKFSAPIPEATATPSAALNGYGEGIYIDNFDDKEMITDGATRREMKQSELQDLLYSQVESSDTAKTKAYHRLGIPALPADPARTLEEQHIRGWIAPDEFRARGALVEIYVDTSTPANSYIAITRDSHADNIATDVTRALGPYVAKGWKDPAGALLTAGGANGGVYRQIFKWPENGVIFAEGNLRVRGGAFNADGTADTTADPLRSLTIVSMNNIYIEGSLNAGKRKILLLAKKNVIVNPTTVLDRPEGKTQLRSALTAGSPTSTIEVTNAALFHTDDYVSVGNQVYRVTAVNGSALNDLDPSDDSITVSPAVDVTLAAGQPVGLAEDPTSAIPAYANSPYNPNGLRIAKVPTTGPGTGSESIVQRYVHFKPGVTTARLAFRHSAERVSAMTLQAEHGTPDVTQVLFSNKVSPTPTPPGVSSTLIPQAAKALTVYEDSGGTLTPALFPTPVPPDAATAVTTTLNTLAGQLNGMTPASPDPSWRITATPTANYTNVPFFFLSGVGNRYNTYYPKTVPWQQNILPPAVAPDVLPYQLPMATSVNLWLNGGLVPVPLQNDFGEQVNQFGFSPDFTAPEDILTTDQSFYRNGTDASGNPVASTDPLYDNTAWTLDSRALVQTITPGAQNSFALKLNDEAVPGAVTPTTVQQFFTSLAMPFYRMLGMKVEDVTVNATNGITSIRPGAAIQINAYVYAQEGSWYVIPGGYFENLKTLADTNGVVTATYLDYNGNNTADAGEYLDVDSSATFTAGDFADLDRDGAISANEKMAAYRYLRNNYKVVFTGAIAECLSPPILPAVDALGNPIPGCVQEWMDKWATLEVPDTGTQLQPSSVQNANYNNIIYNFDPTIASSTLYNATLLNDAGFHPPVLPEWVYQG